MVWWRNAREWRREEKMKMCKVLSKKDLIVILFWKVSRSKYFCSLFRYTKKPTGSGWWNWRWRGLVKTRVELERMKINFDYPSYDYYTHGPNTKYFANQIPPLCKKMVVPQITLVFLFFFSNILPIIPLWAIGDCTLCIHNKKFNLLCPLFFQT